MNSSSHFLKDKPLFGLDIGSSSIKAMQIVSNYGKQQVVLGYGVTGYEVDSVKDGVVIDHKSLAKSIQDLFKHHIVGEIDTRRVAVSIPASRTFTRAMSLPLIRDSELMQAVHIEAEQYIPVPLEDLYIDYTIVDRSDKGIELLAVATPKNC